MPDAPNPTEPGPVAPQPATPLTLAQPPRPPLWQEPYLWFGGAFLVFYFAGMVIGWNAPDLGKAIDMIPTDGGGGGYHSSGGGGFSFGGK